MEAEKKIPPGPHRIVERGILSHISNMNLQFLAVVVSRSCRGKKVQTFINILLLNAVSFYVFMGKKNLKTLLKIL